MRTDYGTWVRGAAAPLPWDRFLWVLLLLAFQVKGVAQDSIPTRPADTIPVTDTVVIRANQYPVRIIPRGVSLTVPRITFNATKPLTKKRKRFRVPSFWEKINELDVQMSQVGFVECRRGKLNLRYRQTLFCQELQIPLLPVGQRSGTAIRVECPGRPAMA